VKARNKLEVTVCRIHLVLLEQLDECQADADLLDERMKRLRNRILDLAKHFVDGSLPTAEESQAVVHADDGVVFEDLMRQYP
jgi:hypothetical protein